MDEFPILSLTPSQTETPTTEVSNALSITLIVHGVGNATSKGLLKSVSDGYLRSELGGISKRAVLKDCPTLTKKKDAESLVIETPVGAHFVAALPWAERRVRLSSIAQLCAGLLLTLAVVASVTFVFRGTLEWLDQWLRSWTHRLIAYAVMTVFNFVVFLLSPNRARQQFKWPSWLSLLLPPLLIIALLYFVEGTWFWIVIAALVVALWIISTLIVGRCLVIAPTLSWRVALAALILAIAIPGISIVRIARHSAIRANEQYRLADSPFASPLTHIPPEVLKAVEKEMNTDDPMERTTPEPRVPKVSASKAETFEPRLKSGRHSKENSGPIKPPSSPGGPMNQVRKDDPLADLEASDSIFNNRERFMKALSNYKPSVVDVVTGPEFLPKLTLAAVCIGLCVLLMWFHWLLDFAFDVLHYGGNQKHRTSLIEALTANIRWVHTQAPNATIVLVGHSLGTVAAAQTLASLSACEAWLNQVVLVTLGSPLNYIGRAFWRVIPSARELADTICAANVRWVNLWRRSDPIGKRLDIGESGTVQYCLGKGGHMDYWSGPGVWRAVAFEALGIGGASSQETSDRRSACIFERSLGLLVFVAIVAIASCGVGLWLISP